MVEGAHASGHLLKVMFSCFQSISGLCSLRNVMPMIKSCLPMCHGFSRHVTQTPKPSALGGLLTTAFLFRFGSAGLPLLPSRTGPEGPDAHDLHRLTKPALSSLWTAFVPLSGSGHCSPDGRPLCIPCFPCSLCSLNGRTLYCSQTRTNGLCTIM